MHVLNLFHFVYEMLGWEVVYVKMIIILGIVHSVDVFSSKTAFEKVGVFPSSYIQIRSHERETIWVAGQVIENVDHYI